LGEAVDRGTPMTAKTVDICATIIYATILTVLLVSPLDQRRPHPRGQYLNERTTATDFFINAAVFVPLGFGLGRCGRLTPLNRLGLILVVTAGTFIFSLAIESIQYLLLPGRYSSIVDVAGDTIGAVLGAWWASRG
jgi:VanZ family protein